MALRNSFNQFGSIAKFFHWCIAFFIIIMLIVGYWMGTLTDKQLKLQIYNYHKILGLTILGLTLLRLCWRWLNVVPSLPVMPSWEIYLEKLVKLVLYISLLLMPLSGWIFSTAADKPPHVGKYLLPMPYISVNTQLRHIFHDIHAFMAWVIIGTLILHMMGALKHHFINKDNVLRRMLP